MSSCTKRSKKKRNCRLHVKIRLLCGREAFRVVEKIEINTRKGNDSPPENLLEQKVQHRLPRTVFFQGIIMNKKMGKVKKKSKSEHRFTIFTKQNVHQFEKFLNDYLNRQNCCEI